MATILTRADEARPLYNDEIDANFTNLNDDKVEKDGSTAITGNQEIQGNLSLSGTTPEITLGNSETLSIGDATNTVSIPGTINGSVTGSSTSLATARNIELEGDVTGNADFDGSANITITTSVDDISGLTADSATALAASRNFSLTGDVTSDTVTFNGTGNVSLTTSIANNSLSLSKLSTIDDLRVLGNVSGGSGGVTEVTIQNDGNFTSASATAIATSSSIKSYVDDNTFDLLDEDDFNSNSEIAAASQQSIKTYVDNATAKTKVTASVTISALGAGASETIDVTVTGAALTNYVIAQPTAALTDTDVAFSAYISATNTVKLIFTNTGAGAGSGQTVDFNFILL
jgi:hypothetical protein